MFSAISRNWISFIDWQKNRGVPAFLKVVTTSWTLLATELPQGPWFWLDAAGVNPTLHHISDGSTLVTVCSNMWDTMWHFCTQLPDLVTFLQYMMRVLLSSSIVFISISVLQPLFWLAMKFLNRELKDLLLNLCLWIAGGWESIFRGTVLLFGKNELFCYCFLVKPSPPSLFPCQPWLLMQPLQL